MNNKYVEMNDSEYEEYKRFKKGEYLDSKISVMDFLISRLGKPEIDEWENKYIGKSSKLVFRNGNTKIIVEQ